MSTQVNVRSIDSLDDLRHVLILFCSGTTQALEATEQEIQRVQEWLEQRRLYWQREVERRQQALLRARSALERCLAQAAARSHDDRHSPRLSCSAEQAAVAQAQSALVKAQTELQNVLHWESRVRQAAVEYQRPAQRLKGMLAGDLPRAVALLARIIAILRSYVAMTPPEASSIGSGNLLAPSSALLAVAQQEQFRDHMAHLDSSGRGGWGERQLRREITQLEHRILLMHEQPTTPGYDGVSWDGQTVHVWEVKNYSRSTPNVENLGALEDRRLVANVAQFLKNLPDDPDRSAIAAAIQANEVQIHIRLGPDTDISLRPLDQLTWSNVDVKQYSYEQMLEVRDG